MAGFAPPITMIQVRYLKSTHDAFAGQKKFIRGDHALILQLAGFVEIVPTVEKSVKDKVRSPKKR